MKQLHAEEYLKFKSPIKKKPQRRCTQWWWRDKRSEIYRTWQFYVHEGEDSTKESYEEYENRQNIFVEKTVSIHEGHISIDVIIKNKIPCLKKNWRAIYEFISYKYFKEVGFYLPYFDKCNIHHNSSQFIPKGILNKIQEIKLEHDFFSSFHWFINNKIDEEIKKCPKKNQSICF